MLAVDASRAPIGAHQLPPALQNVPAIDLVIERVEPASGIGLGRPVERSLQFSDLVLPGGPSHEWHSPALPCARRISEAAALPSPAVVLSARLDRYYGRLRRPPGTRSPSRLKPVVNSHREMSADRHRKLSVGELHSMAPTDVSSGWRSASRRPLSRK